ncbi:2-dehydro-3-deoxygalactonokinase [Altericroceibacterium spongiae]|nr:2-dehydro-3-deoxygalactonokinase [Altericroceibacterium spongiae]
MSEPFLAIDWGTTNRRVYLIENGMVRHTERDDAGAAKISDFEREIAAIRQRHGDYPVLMAGMVGSSIGWQETPYVPAPAGMKELASTLHYIDERTAIVPGMSWQAPDGRCDVMRGEEVQLLGAHAAGLVPEEAVLCQPGTHCKWAWLGGNGVERFVTAMTGELFAMLRQHSLLRPQLGGDVADGDAFRAGVAQGQHRDLAASLFGIRAAAMLDALSDADAASYASGVLIGADVANRMEHDKVGRVYILADVYLGTLYASAIAALGGDSVLIDSHETFVAGISTIRELQE